MKKYSFNFSSHVKARKEQKAREAFKKEFGKLYDCLLELSAFVLFWPFLYLFIETDMTLFQAFLYYFLASLFLPALLIAIFTCCVFTKLLREENSQGRSKDSV